MISIDDLTSAQLQLSVEVNGVYVLLKNVADSLQRFCRPVAFYNNHEYFDLSFSGSGLLMEDRGRKILLCSDHQLSKHDRTPDEMVIVLEDAQGLRRVGLTPDGAIKSVLDPSCDPELADGTDIILAEFSSLRPGHDLSRHFLRLNLAQIPDLSHVPNPDVLFAIGYATADTDYDSKYDEEFNVVATSIVSRWTKLYLSPADRNVWDSKALVPLMPANEDVTILEDPDGMSGSPVFFVHGVDERKLKLGFAGILVRGHKSGRQNMLAASVIREVIERSGNNPALSQ